MFPGGKEPQSALEPTPPATWSGAVPSAVPSADAFVPCCVHVVTCASVPSAYLSVSLTSDLHWLPLQVLTPGAVCICVPVSIPRRVLPAHLEEDRAAWLCPHSPTGLSQPRSGHLGAEADSEQLGGGPFGLQGPPWDRDKLTLDQVRVGMGLGRKPPSLGCNGLQGLVPG